MSSQRAAQQAKRSQAYGVCTLPPAGCTHSKPNNHRLFYASCRQLAAPTSMVSFSGGSLPVS